MPELTRNQQFFLLQPPPSQHQFSNKTNHNQHNCFLPFQLNSLVNQGKQNCWSHQWKGTSNTLTAITTTSTPSVNYPTFQNYSSTTSSSSSSSSSSSCCSSCSSCCPSPKLPSTMNIYPILSNFNYFNFDYQTDCDIICVIDFEATCDNYGGRRQPNDAIMEIIEFPAFIVDTRTRSVVSYLVIIIIISWFSYRSLSSFNLFYFPFLCVLLYSDYHIPWVCSSSNQPKINLLLHPINWYNTAHGRSGRYISKSIGKIWETSFQSTSRKRLQFICHCHRWVSSHFQ